VVGRPVIGITSYVEPASWAAWKDVPAVLVQHGYVRHVHAAGGLAVVIPPLPDDADEATARELLARHAGTHQAEHTPDWRVIVAPVRGTIQQAAVREGSEVRAGTPLGAVISKREEVHVSATYDGVLAEWLVEDGDLVDAGDPLARLYPVGSR